MPAVCVAHVPGAMVLLSRTDDLLFVIQAQDVSVGSSEIYMKS